MTKTATIEPLATPRQIRASVKAKSGLTSYLPHDARTDELLTMLRTMRPAGSKAERNFVDQWIAPLGTTPDGFGNHWLTIGDSRILWSCHTDTVHKSGGEQYVGYTDGCAYVSRSNCLGADDTVGVWIMRHMILAGVPGTYVFHRAEEVGAHGSGWVRENTPERLNGLWFAIAFDRMGYHDIVVDQMGETASDAFAASLSEALQPLDYTAAIGVFTDTQVYSDIIPECSNISVGYHKMHTTSEWQDVDYAMTLLDTMLCADFSTLVAERDPTEEVAPWWDERWDGQRSHKTSAPSSGWGYASNGDVRTMDEMCKCYPEIVSDFLTSQGYDLDDLARYAGFI
jgi:hypothetical protein